jgi:RNA polymerase sigma factor (sigma-70 family)
MSVTQRMINLVDQREVIQRKIDSLGGKRSLLDEQIAAIKPFAEKEERDKQEKLMIAASAIRELTPAEMRIAELVAADLSNSEIATELNVSRRTVETHMTNILSKMGCRSRVSLAVLVDRVERSK